MPIKQDDTKSLNVVKGVRAGGSYLEWISGVDSMSGSES